MTIGRLSMLFLLLLDPEAGKPSPRFSKATDYPTASSLRPPLQERLDRKGLVIW